MFRTSDILQMGYADIFYLRQLQHEIMDKAKNQTSKESIQKGTIGV